MDQGGEDVSESRKQLIRRFAAAAVLAEQLEAKLANGQEIDIAQHALLCSTLTRLSLRIGLNPVAKDISPTLADLIQHDQEQQRGATEKVPEAVP